MAKKQAKRAGKRGGARENSGRPLSPNPRCGVLAIRFTPDELAAITAHGGSRWAREVLLAALQSV